MKTWALGVKLWSSGLNRVDRIRKTGVLGPDRHRKKRPSGVGRRRVPSVVGLSGSRNKIPPNHIDEILIMMRIHERSVPFGHVFSLDIV